MVYSTLVRWNIPKYGSFHVDEISRIQIIFTGKTAVEVVQQRLELFISIWLQKEKDHKFITFAKFNTSISNITGKSPLLSLELSDVKYW